MRFKPPVPAMAALVLIFLTAPVMAQDIAPALPPLPGTEPAAEIECFPPTAEITTLREPRFDEAKSVWTTMYAKDGMDVFTDVALLDAGHFVAAGSYTKDKDDAVYHPLLVKYDERQKIVWEVRAETKELRTINRILRTKDGFTVLGDITDGKRGNGVYIASYDDAGKVKGAPIPFYDADGSLDAKSFVPSQDGTGYIIAAQYVENPDKQYGVLYKISKSGNQIWKRTFQSGTSTAFQNIQTAQDGSYMVTGQVVVDKTKSSAWFLVVDENGAIKWQRSYPRGMAATFQSAAQTTSGNYILTGKARPFDYQGKGLSAWVMKVDSSGNPLWQRYLKGAYSYGAPDIIVYEDGRASVLMNVEGMKGDQVSHARIATFSPQGQLQHLEEYMDGQNASAHRMIAGMDGERLIIGHAQTSYGDKQEGNEAAAAPTYTYDGWLVAAVPLDIYEDPCAGAASVSPILP